MSIMAELENLYEEYRGNRGDRLAERDPGNVSPPLLLSVDERYLLAKPRVLLVGQSTYGWSWLKPDERVQYPDWTCQEIMSFKDFKERSDAVRCLMEGYRLFDFAKRQLRTTFNSPFWRFFRGLLTDLGLGPDAGMWTNLFRVDVGGEAPAGEMLSDIGEFQKGLLRREIELLDPNVIVFATGHGYDGEIARALKSVAPKSIAGYEDQVLCELVVAGWERRVFRTYHPGYLNRIRRAEAVRRGIVSAVSGR